MEGWDVPVATAVWAIVVEQLARWRREAPELGDNGLAIAAAVTVLRLKPLRAGGEHISADRSEDHAEGKLP